VKCLSTNNHYFSPVTESSAGICKKRIESPAPETADQQQ
jgi:hypothetical protein